MSLFSTKAQRNILAMTVVVWIVRLMRMKRNVSDNQKRTFEEVLIEALYIPDRTTSNHMSGDQKRKFEEVLIEALYNPEKYSKEISSKLETVKSGADFKKHSQFDLNINYG